MASYDLTLNESCWQKSYENLYKKVVSRYTMLFACRRDIEF